MMLMAHQNSFSYAMIDRIQTEHIDYSNLLFCNIVVQSTPRTITYLNNVLFYFI